MLIDSTSYGSTATDYTFTNRDSTKWIQINNDTEASSCLGDYAMLRYDEGYKAGRKSMKESYKNYKAKHLRKINQLKAELKEKQHQLELLITKQQFKFKGFKLWR